jgi:hypothetical protein
VILAFGNQSRTGKDAACKAIVDMLAIPGSSILVEQRSFARRLKQAAALIYGDFGLRQPEFYETPEGARERNVMLPDVGMTPVQLWIHLGNTQRAAYPDVWVAPVIDDVARDQRLVGGRPTLVVISDLRFKNEGEAILAAGGWCVQVQRPDAPPPLGSDNSMGPDFPWSDVLVNDGTIEQLRAKARALAVDFLRAKSVRLGTDAPAVNQFAEAASRYAEMAK